MSKPSKDDRPAALRLAGSVALMIVAIAACGDLEDASLCTAFDEWRDARAAVSAIDVTSETAAEAVEDVEDYLASVRRLDQAADGRYGQELADLEATINDGLSTLRSVQPDADYETWAPLVEDDRELAADAATQVEQAIAPSCQVDVSDTSGTDPSETSET